jgi:hypothetical protein
MALSPEKVAGAIPHSVREKPRGFKLNHEWHLSVPPLRRPRAIRVRTWTLEGDMVFLQGRPWAGSDFELVASDTSGRGITIKVTNPNPVFQKGVFVSLKNGEEGSWQTPNTNGEVFFPANETGKITLAFEFCPERITLIPNKEHNYFEFRLQPWALEVFFNKFSLKAKRRVLLGRHPLLKGEEFIYEKS